MKSKKHTVVLHTKIPRKRFTLYGDFYLTEGIRGLDNLFNQSPRVKIAREIYTSSASHFALNQIIR